MRHTFHGIFSSISFYRLVSKVRPVSSPDGSPADFERVRDYTKLTNLQNISSLSKRILELSKVTVAKWILLQLVLRQLIHRNYSFVEIALLFLLPSVCFHCNLL